MASEDKLIQKTQTVGITLLIIAVSTVLIIGTVIVFKKFVLKSDSEKQSESTTKAAAKDIKISRLSFDDATYKSLADRISIAMFGWGTDTDTVYNVIGQLKNSDDWNKLVVTFGTRKEPGWGGFEGNLVQWLESELDDSEMAKVQEKLRAIGVTF